eukprot:CAMPEP_0114510300 /NCGR_PEP_ID=MMETSP0109-20121206/13705_1 /TAXON_ID=29199 /ORGANISM="Chlorarachnion reptans, Strain CCCM449" /LENGTH=549 /DNA_ID=CAMNT_0001689581 /DNA_START=72 /DNA_END=1721 /DNA_ORIENTATION=+
MGSYASTPEEERALEAKLNRDDAISEMNKIQGFDVVIVCCTSGSQTGYWQQRLEESKGFIAPKTARVFAVEEDWADGGAGNGLGTLYAWQKAVKMDSSIEKDLKAGTISVGLYHTAGKGTRLAPMPGSECNNKPAVKLPAVIKTDKATFPLTILEAVIKQTGVYASSRKGRLSVFWGDQVFIPSVKAQYTPTHHADILARLGPMPDKEEYNSQGLFNYGLICVEKSGDAKQIEKVSYETAVGIGTFEKVGTSVGSFSVSHTLLGALMTEFKSELAAKKGKMDTDPHFWMPLTLDKKTYADFMLTKGEFDTKEASDTHYARIERIKAVCDGVEPKGRYFGSVDVGQDAYWWDYGQVAYYMENNLKLLKGSTSAEKDEANAMKAFLGLEKGDAKGPLKAANCVVSDCKVAQASTSSNSVLSSVYATSLEVQESILVNVTAANIKCKNCLLYNVADTKDIELGEGEILVGMTVDGKAFQMRSKFNVCGKKNWKKWTQSGTMSEADLKLVSGNPYTFEQIYKLNKKADVEKISEAVSKQFQSCKESVLKGAKL